MQLPIIFTSVLSRTENNPYSDGLHLVGGRRFLRDLVIKETQKSVFRTKYMTMGAPGLLLLCCSFLCSCFRSRRKDTDDVVLVRESNSSEYIYEYKLHYVSIFMLNVI